MSISVNEIQNGTENNFYIGVVAYTVYDKHYMFGQTKTQDNWHYIQEVLPDGRLGEQTEHSSWSHYYDFITVLDDDGKKVLCCTSSQDNVIKLVELTYDGKTKPLFEESYLQDDFETLTLYMRHGKLFAFCQHRTTKEWKVLEIEYSP
ncbi:hypothetical protein J8V57_05965 [Xenorhabdus sp. PB61.4]|uniref:hypothetical protein n=1 Tax=Xenorhabdus sp. PB61.4 TaxID=2788940 RepID=UPI001E2CC721|nr:hypothetical protein [Xenorhabdus sp. PB61.4]MCC8365830.1 hypothetical protein [Xenorhabdus sp. PB61.4]